MATDPLLSVAALKTLSAHSKERYDQMRSEAEALLNPGDRRVVLSPLDGTPLGEVYRAKPETQASITEEPALVDWLTNHGYNDRVASSYKVVGSAAEVIDVLFQHAPRLLKRVRSVTSDARKELLANSKAVGQPIGPNNELDVPGISVAATGPTYVACRQSDDALRTFYDLITSGRIELDGTVRPELEADGDA